MFDTKKRIATLEETLQSALDTIVKQGNEINELKEKNKKLTDDFDTIVMPMATTIAILAVDKFGAELYKGKNKTDGFDDFIDELDKTNKKDKKVN